MQFRSLRRMMRQTTQLGVFLGSVGVMMVAPVIGQEAPAPPPADEPMAVEPTPADASAPILNGAVCGPNGCTTCDPCQTCCEDTWCSCDLGDPWLLADQFCCTKSSCDPCTGTVRDPFFTVGGWTQWGYHSEANGLFNSHPHRVNNHQSYLFLERVADGSCGWDFGFRADLVYGVDAQDTQAFGDPNQTHWDNEWDHGIYGWALPQLYATAAYGNWTIMAGKFYTLVGYEVVPATGNFFYSHAYTMYNSEPFTHTGVVTTYQASDRVKIYNGWTAGWDTGFDRFNDGTPNDTSKGSNYIGGVSVDVTDAVTVTYITTIGDLGLRGEGYSHSIVTDVQLTDNWEYVLQSDLVETNAIAGHLPVDGFDGGSNQYGLNQYLFYTVNDCLKFGTRLEWWKNNGHSQYAWTAGVNYKPHANLIIRPEVRHDWNPSGFRFNGDGKDDFTTFGIDAILTF